MEPNPPPPPTVAFIFLKGCRVYIAVHNTWYTRSFSFTRQNRVKGETLLARWGWTCNVNTQVVQSLGQSPVEWWLASVCTCRNSGLRPGSKNLVISAHADLHLWGSYLVCEFALFVILPCLWAANDQELSLTAATMGCILSQNVWSANTCDSLLLVDDALEGTDTICS